MILGINDVFVFASNINGIHNTDIAKKAVSKYGAKEGCGLGPHRNSFAIPILDDKLKILDLDSIKSNIDQFKLFAEVCPIKKFYISSITKGIDETISRTIIQFFIGSPNNCIFPKDWNDILGNSYSYFSE